MADLSSLDVLSSHVSLTYSADLHPNSSLSYPLMRLYLGLHRLSPAFGQTSLPLKYQSDHKQRDKCGNDSHITRDETCEHSVRPAQRDKDRGDEQEDRDEEHLFAVFQEDRTEYCGDDQGEEKSEHWVGL